MGSLQLAPPGKPSDRTLQSKSSCSRALLICKEKSNITSEKNGVRGKNGGSLTLVGSPTDLGYPDPRTGGCPGGSVVKNPPTDSGDAGDAGSIPELRRSPGEGKGYPPQYSCLENSMARGN